MFVNNLVKKESLYALGLAIALIIIQGCGSASRINSLQTLNKNTVLNQQQGIVVARVINASGVPLPFNELTLTPENINESDKIKYQELSSLEPNMSGSTVFASPVNSGNYSLNSVSTYFSDGNGYLSRFARADAKFGTFTVEPNQITDLGTIIFYTKPQEDRYLEMLVHLPEVEMGEVLDKYFPYYQYDKQRVLGWNDDGLDEERQSDYLSVAQNPITFNKTYLSPDKSLYFLAKLGIIVKRNSLGDWELDAVDTNLDLNTVAQNKKGDLVVGGSEGRLFWKPIGQSWNDESLANDLQIEDISFTDENHITALIRSETAAIVLRARTDSSALDWQELNRFDVNKGWKNYDVAPKEKIKKTSKARRIYSTSLSKIGEKNFVRVSSKRLDSPALLSSSKNEMFQYDKQSWIVSKVESQPEVTAAIDAGATKLGIKEPGFWSWSGKPTYYRYLNQSDSWDEIKTSLTRCSDGKFITQDGCIKNTDDKDKKKKSRKNKDIQFTFRAVPWFKNELEAIAFVNFTDYNAWTGKRSSENKILSTTDGGKTWIDTQRSLPKEYCSRLITQVSDRLLVGCNGASGDFYESKDDGASWQHVRQQENF